MLDADRVYEFGLTLPPDFANNIFLFNDYIPTVSEGLNGIFQEKIRRFNNSAGHLVNSIQIIETLGYEDKPLLLYCTDMPTEIDGTYRQLLRNVYMELFIYQEKLLNIVCNLFFVKVSKTRNGNLTSFKARAQYFPVLRTFCDECIALSKDNRYRIVMSIRDDEIHNMSQIDSFILDLEVDDTGWRIVSKGYQLKASELHDNYIYAMERLLNIRDIVQQMINETNFCAVRKVLEENGEEIWIN